MQGENPSVRRNSICFGVFLLIIQTIVCVMFGLYLRLPGQETNSDFNPIFILFCHSMLVVVGFGLFFSYLKNMVWTGMGFSLLITALSIELYFLVNTFWTKVRIMYSSETLSKFMESDKTYDLYLTSNVEVTDSFTCLTGCFKCGLAMMVAFSAIQGRAGFFQALLVTLFGTIGYELNRQIIFNYTTDAGGTNAIFVFGGFMGLMLGILRRAKEREPSIVHESVDKGEKKKTEKGEFLTIRHPKYTADRFSSSLALLGVLVIWVFFPVLTADYLWEDVSTTTNYTSPYSVWYSLAAATVTAFALSPLFNNGINVRDVICGTVAGGVACSSASYYIVNPVYAIVIGITSAAIQVIVMNVIEKKVAMSSAVWNTYSFTLFGIQGIIGSAFQAGWFAITKGRDYGFTYNFFEDFKNQPLYAWIISLISAGMGIVFGILVGIILLCVTNHNHQDFFNDFTYWRKEDGISEQITPVDLYVKQNRSQVKQKHGYL